MRISDWSSDVCSSDLTSSHRSYAISEKSAPGNGITDPNDVLDAGRNAAKRFYCLDLQALADKAGSVISASLFGALAGSGALPFARADFEATIERAGVGVAASLNAFGKIGRASCRERVCQYV